MFITNRFIRQKSQTHNSKLNYERNNVLFGVKPTVGLETHNYNQTLIPANI